MREVEAALALLLGLEPDLDVMTTRTGVTLDSEPGKGTMARTTYDTPATAADEALIADLFALGGVGYVALGRGSDVLMRIHADLRTTTTPESNFYEELLVNPTLLALAGQRAALDCGGLDHLAVGYAKFTQLLVRTREGHVSLGASRNAPARELAAKVHAVLAKHGRSAPAGREARNG